MPIILLFIILHLNAFANSNLGLSFNTSTFDNAPTQNTNNNIPNGYQKSSMMLFGQSSFSKNTRFLTAKLETINITRKEFTINGYNFNAISSSGIRSAELMFGQYLFTYFGWKTFLNVGYNSKGTQNNENIKFALAGQEFVIGTTLIKNPKYKDPTLAPILTGLLNISEKRTYMVQINRVNGLGYNAFELIGNFVLPIHKNINLKLLGKLKNYNLQKDAPLLFRNENKVMAGLIFKGNKHHSIEFSIYYDDIIKEKGVSIGYLYFFHHNKKNPLYQTIDNMKEKNSKPQENPQDKTTTHDEMKQTIRETLEEMGY